jgi:hypothetical protein
VYIFGVYQCFPSAAEGAEREKEEKKRMSKGLRKIKKNPDRSRV